MFKDELSILYEKLLNLSSEIQKINFSFFDNISLLLQQSINLKTEGLIAYLFFITVHILTEFNNSQTPDSEFDQIYSVIKDTRKIIDSESEVYKDNIKVLKQAIDKFRTTQDLVFALEKNPAVDIKLQEFLFLQKAISKTRLVCGELMEDYRISYQYCEESAKRKKIFDQCTKKKAKALSHCAQKKIEESKVLMDRLLSKDHQEETAWDGKGKLSSGAKTFIKKMMHVRSNKIFKLKSLESAQQIKLLDKKCTFDENGKFMRQSNDRKIENAMKIAMHMCSDGLRKSIDSFMIRDLPIQK